MNTYVGGLTLFKMSEDIRWSNGYAVGRAGADVACGVSPSFDITFWTSVKV